MTRSQPSADSERFIDDYLLADGRVRYRVRIRFPDGTRPDPTFDTLEEAIDWRDEALVRRRRIKREIRGNGSSEKFVDSPERTTVTEFVGEIWWQRDAVHRLSPRTQRNYRRVFERFIEPSPLADLPVTEVDAEHILDWQEWCRSPRISATVDLERTAHKVLSGAYKWGARRPRSTGIRANPLALAQWPTETRAHLPYIASPQTVELVRQAILTNPHSGLWNRQRDALLFSMMFQTGGRPGDVRRVRVCDFRFGNGSRGSVNLNQTKKDEPRPVPLFRTLEAEVNDWIRVAGLAPGDYPFAKSNGEPLDFDGWQSWRDRIFAPARDRVARQLGDPDLASARAYDLCRHSYAALQLAGLMSLPELSEIMGNSVEVLAKTYAAPLRETAERGYRIDPEKEIEDSRRNPRQRGRW